MYGRMLSKPPHKGLNEGAERRAEGHPASHRAEQPAQWPATALVGEEITDEGKSERHDPTGAPPCQKAPNDEVRRGLSRGRPTCPQAYISTSRPPMRLKSLKLELNRFPSERGRF